VESHCVDDSFSRLGETWCGAGDSLRLDGIRERFELMNMCSGRLARLFFALWTKYSGFRYPELAAVRGTQGGRDGLSGLCCRAH
jgi:hypothetical protein